MEEGGEDGDNTQGGVRKEVRMEEGGKDEGGK